MDYFPAFLKLKDRSVLVVGGGAVAARKTKALLAAHASVTVVARQAGPGIATLAEAGKLRLVQRGFRPEDLRDQWLVVNATDDPRTGRRIAHAAQAARVFCNSVDDLEHCSYIVPAIVDRSPLVVAISSGGSAPVLARRLRARLEVLLPASLGKVADLAGRWRARVGHAMAGLRERRYFWERLFDGRLEDAMRHGGVTGGERLISAELERLGQPDEPAGFAWLVGAGPGDPELLTLKALQAMQTADVILHDRLVAPEVLALARRDAEFVAVGKTPGSCVNSQASINRLLVERVAAGERVCRLKGGDPFVFGRGGEEAAALEGAGLPFVVVPGITAALGCAAAAGIPLTHRDAAQAVTFLTGHGKDAADNIDWPALADRRQTLAIYMGVRRARDLMQSLTSHGRPADTPVAIIEHGTTPDQRIIRGTLGQLHLLVSAHRVVAPALLIVGEVARLGAGVTAPVDTRAAVESAITSSASAVTGG